MNNCPVYRHVGGWAYGWVYPGPLGEVLVPQLLGIETAWKLPFACSLCGACTSICPVKIDLSHLIVKNRRRAVKAKTPAGNIIETLTWKQYAVWMQTGWRFRFLMRFIKLGIKMTPFLPRPLHLDKLGAWTRGRTLPEVPKDGSFRDWWSKRRGL